MPRSVVFITWILKFKMPWVKISTNFYLVPFKFAAYFTELSLKKNLNVI